MGKNIHAFWHIEGTDYTKLSKIDKFFSGNFEYAWCRSSASELAKAGLGKEYAGAVITLRNRLDLGRAMEKLWQEDIFLIDRKSPEYPAELLQIALPPFLIYRKGAALNSLTKRVAIIGTRKSTMGGEKNAFTLAKTLAWNGITIVSGLAFGIDAAAHTGAVKAEGKTIGILASGIAQITPSSHHRLSAQILEKGGAILSEYPVTSPAFKHRFLERNRLISGISEAVVIVEAGKKSGAGITAKHACEQNKDVLAFPGDPGKASSAGCNHLIKTDRARLVDSVADVIQYLQDRGLIKSPSDRNKRVPEVELDLSDRQVFTILEKGAQSSDELMEMSRIEWELLLQSLSKLEIAGVVGRDEQSRWKLLPGY
jgi:DNA processing protein